MRQCCRVGTMRGCTRCALRARRRAAARARLPLARRCRGSARQSGQQLSQAPSTRVRVARRQPGSVWRRDSCGQCQGQRQRQHAQQASAQERAGVLRVHACVATHNPKVTQEPRDPRGLATVDTVRRLARHRPREKRRGRLDAACDPARQTRQARANPRAAAVGLACFFERGRRCAAGSGWVGAGLAPARQLRSAVAGAQPGTARQACP